MSEQNEAVTSEAAVREMRATLRANPASAPATPAMAVGGVAIAPRSVPGDQASTGVAPPDEVTQSRGAP